MVKRLLACIISCALCVETVPALAQGYNLPNLGAAGGATISPLEERKLGEEIMLEVKSDPTYLADPETTEYLNKIGYKLVAASPANSYSYNFFAVKDPSLNAFALPGGFIAVHSGLIIATSSESELASVMAHEIAHVGQRHIARMIEGQKGNLAATIGSLLLAILAARSGSGDGAVAAVVGTQAALAQNYLSFSRDAEREADRVGFNTLQRAGFDTRGMKKFFQKLDVSTRVYEGAGAAPAYLRTHPMTIDRMSEAENRLRNAKIVNHKDSLDFFLIQARLRVIQTNRFQGWKDAADYFKEDLKTATGYRAVADHYGLALAAQKMKNDALALKEIEIAGKMGKSPIISKLHSQLVFESSRANQGRGIEIAKQAFNANPLSQTTVENYANLLQKGGRAKEVVEMMKKQHAFTKRSPTYQRILGRAYEALGQRSLSHQAIGEMYALQGMKTAAVQQFSLAQKANDGNFYTMSEIDARLRDLRREIMEDKKYNN